MPSCTVLHLMPAQRASSPRPTNRRMQRYNSMLRASARWPSCSRSSSLQLQEWPEPDQKWLEIINIDFGGSAIKVPAGFLGEVGLDPFLSSSYKLSLDASLDLENSTLLPNGRGEILLPTRFPDNELPKVHVSIRKRHQDDCSGQRALGYFCTKQFIESEQVMLFGLTREDEGCTNFGCFISYGEGMSYISLRFDTTIGDDLPQAEAMTMKFLKDIGINGLPSPNPQQN